MNKIDKSDFHRLLHKLTADPRTHRMKSFIHHGRITTYDHCMSVARMSFALGRLLHICIHEEDLVRGAFLHDYFLYDWHNYKGPLHGIHHADTALKNAIRDFSLNKREQNIIKSHMWPLTLRSLPASREALIVCLVDKIVSTKETLFERRR